MVFKVDFSVKNVIHSLLTNDSDLHWLPELEFVPYDAVKNRAVAQWFESLLRLLLAELVNFALFADSSD